MARGVQVSRRRLFRELGHSVLSLRDPRVGTSIGHALYANAGDQRRALHRPFRSLRDVLLSRVHSQVEGSTAEDDLRVEVLRIVEYFYAVQYVSIAPTPPLAEFIERFWYSSDAPGA
jgi:hypothetical protein